jgi:hypothetical protein
VFLSFDLIKIKRSVILSAVDVHEVNVYGVEGPLRPAETLGGGMVALWGAQSDSVPTQDFVVG